MEKGYVKRLIFWGIIFLITTACAGLGVYFYYSGYGETGKIRQKLLPIVERFNTTNYITELKTNNNIDVHAKVVQNKIVVSYITSSNETKFEFVYSKEGNMEVITNKYNTSDSVSGEIIARGMIDAVFKANNGIGSLFDTYKINDFVNTTLEQGVNVITGNDIQIKININENIMDNLNNYSGSNQDQDQNTNTTDYITTNDLDNILVELESQNRYEISKSTIKVLVINNNDNYQIYIENTENNEDNTYNSLINVILLLNPTVYDTIIINNDRLNENVKTDIYTVITDAKVEVDNTFNKDSSILEIILNK